MKKITSLYLDVMRFTAAAAVFFSHSFDLYHINIPILSGYGPESVAVFFVLSGYVIAYVSEEKETSLRDYFKARAVRIYSVIIPALVLTWAVDFIGQTVNFDFYHVKNNIHDHSLGSFLQILSFSGELLNRHVVFGSDEPLWSIGFECIYYLIFGLLFFIRKPAGWILSLPLLILSFPKVLIYFPLWIFGVYARKKGDISGILFIPSLIGVALTHHIAIPHNSMFRAVYFDWKALGSLVYFWSLGLFVAINIASAERFLNGFGVIKNILLRGELVIRGISKKTFSLYATHLPIMMMICCIIDNKSRIFAFIGMMFNVIFCFVFSEVFENKDGVAFKIYSYGWQKISRRKPLKNSL
jgi:peptidoglycan/LPS O-acetylase OafA/YrhL